MKKTWKSLALLAIIATVIAGCGAEKDSNKAGTGNTSGEGAEKKVETINVGTMGTYSPFSYKDENDNLTGYDLEVIKLIDAKIPELEFEFLPTPWDSMFLSLDSKKFGLIANQITKNPEREEKYNFSEQPYFTNQSSIIVKKGQTAGINSLDDLKGKTVGSAVGDSFTKVLEDYNKANDNALNIKYYDGDVTPVLQDVAAGRIDAYLNDPIMAGEAATKLGLEIEIAGDPVQSVPTHFVFRKDKESEELKAKVDKALKELIDEGELTKLSIEWFGKDYSK